MMVDYRRWTLLVFISLIVTACSKYEEPVWRSTQNPTGPAGSGNGSTATGPVAVPPPASKPSYLDNGIIRVAVDLARGGAITYLSAVNGNNIINTLDLGRYIQSSYYSGPRPFKPNGKEPSSQYPDLGWNPVLAGDAFGNTSKVVEFQNTGTRIYVKTIPQIWPLPDEPAECTVETWLELDNNTVKVRYRLNNNRADHTQYSALPQELPAVFTDRTYHKVVTYLGPRPYTSDAVSDVTYQPDPNNLTRTEIASENWLAILNDANWGLGLWEPNLRYFINSIHGSTAANDPSSATYVTPSAYEILDHNIQYDYSFVLVVGSLDQIRQFAYQQPKATVGPNYQFTGDRQQWWYYQGSDTGWPIQGALNVSLEKGNFLMVGPYEHWQADAIPKLYVKAAFKTDAQHARLRWRVPGDPQLMPEKVLDFPIITDGEYHTYELDMTQAPAWKGTIIQLDLEPALEEKGGAGKFARIQSITVNP